MCCNAKKVWQVFAGLLGISSVIWITADQIFDCLISKQYYDRTNKVLEERGNITGGTWHDPFSSEALNIVEGRFFIASASSIVLPALAATFIFVVYHMIEWSVRIKTFCKEKCPCSTEGCCSTAAGMLCCVSAAPFTFISAVVSGIIVPIAFAVFPLLQFIVALFKLFGIAPTDQNDHPIQGPGFKRFWLLVMLLRLCEQFLEAPLQIVINVTYTAVYDPEGCDGDNNLLTIWESDKTFVTKLNESYQTCIFSLYISTALSIGSFLMFIISQVYQLSYHYDQSVVAIGIRLYNDAVDSQRFRKILQRMTSRERTADSAEEGETVPLTEVQVQKPEESDNKTGLKEDPGETVPMIDVQVQKPEESEK